MKKVIALSVLFSISCFATETYSTHNVFLEDNILKTQTDKEPVSGLIKGIFKQQDKHTCYLEAKFLDGKRINAKVYWMDKQKNLAYHFIYRNNRISTEEYHSFLECNHLQTKSNSDIIKTFLSYSEENNK